MTENHPAVQAMVVSALEDAKPVLTPPSEPISKILKRVTEEVYCIRCLVSTHLFDAINFLASEKESADAKVVCAADCKS